MAEAVNTNNSRPGRGTFCLRRQSQWNSEEAEFNSHLPEGPWRAQLGNWGLARSLSLWPGVQGQSRASGSFWAEGIELSRRTLGNRPQPTGGNSRHQGQITSHSATPVYAVPLRSLIQVPALRCLRLLATSSRRPSWIGLTTPHSPQARAAGLAMAVSPASALCTSPT